MAESGFNTALIAELYNVSPPTVRRLIVNQRVRGHNHDLPRSGRPRKLDERALRHLNQSLEQDRRQTLGDLTNLITTACQVPISTKTTARAIKQFLNMSSRVARKKPFLKETHRRVRFKWAKMVQNWGVEEWTRIIWTDEASVELGKNTRVCRVWRRPGEAYINKCLAPTFKSGRVSMMVWSCIAYNYKGPLVFLPKGRGTGVGYVESVMSGPLWDVYMEIYDARGAAKVMEDGAPMHRSAIAKEFRTTHSMDTIMHPAQSPDMNPIEHVWKVLKERVNKRLHRPKNAEELKTALLEEWEKIEIELINHLIESMEDRVSALLRAKGGSTRY